MVCVITNSCVYCDMLETRPAVCDKWWNAQMRCKDCPMVNVISKIQNR